MRLMSVDTKNILKIIFERIPKNPVNIPELYADSMIQKEMPEMVGFLRKWNYQAVILRTIHITLGSSAVFFSMLAASGITSEFETKFFAFVAAVSIGIMASFNLGEKSNNFRTAWRNLNATIIKFNQGLCQKDDVIRTYQTSEALIGDVIFRREGGTDSGTPILSNTEPSKAAGIQTPTSDAPKSEANKKPK